MVQEISLERRHADYATPFFLVQLLDVRMFWGSPQQVMKFLHV